jgi:hypothetical protein
MNDLKNINQANLVKALQMGIVDWFQYFELWKKLED